MVKRLSPLLMLGQLEATNPFGFNWRATKVPGSGDLGNGRVVRPDPKEAAKAWKLGGGKGRSDWEEHAKRLGVFPDDIEKGWEALGDPEAAPTPSPKKSPAARTPAESPVDDVRDRLRFGEALDRLKAVFGESTSWSGYSVANFGAMTAPALGFHTKAAEEVWKVAKKVADEIPKESTRAIVGKAMDTAKVLFTELTPEDMALLDMAVNWYLAGKATGMETPTPPYNGNKTAGARADAALPSTSFRGA